MLISEQKRPTSSGQNSAFLNTAWTEVFAAGRAGAPNSSQALEALCRHYWYPIYAFLRRWGYDRQKARDLTQGFFAYLIEQSLLAKADPHKGRFRSFILGSLKIFVSNQQVRERALKRGGGAQIVSIDEQTAEGRYLYEPVSNITPEKLFDRRWALELLGEAMARLQSEYSRAGLADNFKILQPYLVGEEHNSFAALATQLNKSEGATRVLVCRLRNRFRNLIRNMIADTVLTPEQVDQEFQDLLAALRA